MEEPLKAKPLIWTNKVDGLDMMDHLFNRLSAILLDKWTKNFQEPCLAQKIEDWREEWLGGLQGYTGEEIRRGLDGCRNISWTPVLGQFINLCRPPPDYETLFNEACREIGKHAATRKWTSRMSYHAANVFGHFELKNATWSAAKTRWTKIIDEMRAIGELDPIPEYHEALPKPGRTTPDMKRINHYLADLHRIVGNQDRAKELS